MRLPDISDVQVIIHTEWEGEPPNVIEDQVTYPMVTALLAAPHVKAVRAQTMFGDSYVFVVFEDGTDIYWARSRVLEYLQQIAGRLPPGVIPRSVPTRPGAGWVYEYALVIDRSHKHSLADLRSLQDWYLRYQLETVPGVAEVATIGGFVRQYQVKLDPNKLLRLWHPALNGDRPGRDSTNEVGGDVLEMSGARIHGARPRLLEIAGGPGERSVDDQERHPGPDRDLGTVAFGPDMREGVAEWNGEGETVGGIVVMRYGDERAQRDQRGESETGGDQPSLAARRGNRTGVRPSGLIEESIETLQRDLIEEADHRQPRDHYLSVPLPLRADSDSHPADRRARGVHPHVLPGCQLQHHVAWRAGAGHRRAGGRRDRHGRERLSASVGTPADLARRGAIAEARRTTDSDGCGQAGRAGAFLLAGDHRGVVPARVPAGSPGRPHVPAAGLDQDLAVSFSSLLAITLVPVLMLMFIRGQAAAGIAEIPISRFTQALYLPVLRCVPAPPKTHDRC